MYVYNHILIYLFKNNHQVALCFGVYVLAREENTTMCINCTIGQCTRNQFRIEKVKLGGFFFSLEEQGTLKLLPFREHLQVDTNHLNI